MRRQVGVVGMGGIDQVKRSSELVRGVLVKINPWTVWGGYGVAQSVRPRRGVLMAPIGAHRRILAKFRRGELRALRVLLVSFLIRAVIFSVLRLRRRWRASHRAAYACLYIYKKVRKQNFPSGGYFV